MTKLAAKPDDLSGVIEYNNQYYSLHGSPLVSENNYNKIQNLDFYILTLAAIAKELKSRNKGKSQTIRIAAGLPQKWYLQQNVDIIPVENGKPVESDCKIDLHGCNWLINEVREAVESRLMKSVPESVIQDYILTHDKKSTTETPYEKILQEELKKYCDLIFARLLKFKIDPELIPIVFLGGGAEIIYRYGTYGNNVSFILDVSANAKGFEQIDKAFAKLAEKGR